MIYQQNVSKFQTNEFGRNNNLMIFQYFPKNISINKYKSRTTASRGGGEFAISLDELDDCVAGENVSTEDLGRLISKFLYGEKKEVRQVFVRRYFYSDSISDIAKRFAMSEPKVKSMLHRTRLALREFLTENDVNI